MLSTKQCNPNTETVCLDTNLLTIQSQSEFEIRERDAVWFFCHSYPKQFHVLFATPRTFIMTGWYWLVTTILSIILSMAKVLEIKLLNHGLKMPILYSNWKIDASPCAYLVYILYPYIIVFFTPIILQEKSLFPP